MATRLGNTGRSLPNRAAAEYAGLAFNTLKRWRCENQRPSFCKLRSRPLYDVRDLDEFIRSGIRISSVRASREERNVALSTR